MRASIPVLLSLALLLSACGKSPGNAAAPAASTVPAATSAVAATSAAAASTVPEAVTSSAVAGATTVAPGEATTAGPERAGEVALAQGSVTDTATDGSRRQLKDGDDVYPGDSFVLGSDSYLDLDLEDTGRILLRPNTSFQIKSFHYEPDAHDPSTPTGADGQPLIKPQQPENAFFRLIKGGLRAIDGVIGHTSPQNYGVETPVATIGVRGTAFDVRYCGDDCSDEADASGKPDNGLYTSVTDGTVDVKNDDGDVVTPAGHSGFVKSRKHRMQALKAPPKALRHMSLPEKLKPRAEKNRSNLRIKRQKRRALILQRRRQAAAARAKAAAQGKPLPAMRGPAKGQKPETPAEKRQQQREEMRQQKGRTAAPAAPTKSKSAQQQRQELREREQEKQRAIPASGRGKPGSAVGAVKPEAKERSQERRQERRQEKRQADRPAQPLAAAAVKKGKAEKKSADDDKCKDKKKRKKGKDKDKCGDD